MENLLEAIEAALGTTVTESNRLGGGDVAQAFRVRLRDGTSVFAKTHPSPPPNFFPTEAAGLDWLRAADAVAIPEVLAVRNSDPALLVLSWIDSEAMTPDDGAFGRQLAALHQSGSDTFGRSDGATTGSLALPNPPSATWVEFYAECRLVPLGEIAAERGALDGAALAMLDDVITNLEALGGPPEPPARLHGDLWGGNRLIDHTGRSWLIDPAAHGGHREYDLAMMRLFGGFTPTEFAAYEQVYPLAPGWRHRIALHQLAPLIVHAIKFGGGYGLATERALQSLTSPTGQSRRGPAS